MINACARAFGLAGIGALLLAAFSCQAATEVSVQLQTNVPYDSAQHMTVALFFDNATSPSTAVDRPWGSDGRIGTLTAVPRESKEAPLTIRVVMAIGRRPESCVSGALEGCIVSRRRVHFIPNRALVVPIALWSTCRAVGCPDDRTCDIHGACAPASLNAEDCLAPKGCLLPGDPEYGSTPVGKPPSASTDASAGDASEDRDAPPIVAPSCTDGTKNGSETDVDCGGSCPLCGLGKSCAAAEDCSSRYCGAGVCASPPECTGLQAGSPWPSLRRCQRHDGRTNAPSLATNHVKWSYPTGTFITSSPAIAADGTVYIGGGSGRLYALTSAGTLKWSYLTGSRVDSSPSIAADGTVYVGSSDASVYALTPAGTLKWSVPVGGNVDASPTVAADGTIYVESSNGLLRALRPADGSIRWTYNAMHPLNHSAPAIAPDGTLYFGDTTDTFHAVNPSDGSSKWKFVAGSAFSSSPAIASDGTIYVGNSNGNVYALRPADGSVKWTSAMAAIFSSPAIGSDGTVYIGSWDYYLHALNPADGVRRWRYLTGAQVYSSPAVAGDGTVYVGSHDNAVHAVTSTGTLRWSYRTGSVVHSSPAIGADGVVYVGSGDGSVYAFGP